MQARASLRFGPGLHRSLPAIEENPLHLPKRNAGDKQILWNNYQDVLQ